MCQGCVAGLLRNALRVDNVLRAHQAVLKNYLLPNSAACMPRVLICSDKKRKLCTDVFCSVFVVTNLCASPNGSTERNADQPSAAQGTVQQAQRSAQV